MKIIAKQINKKLKNAKNVLIVIHKNPDGDTLGSGTAIFNYLTSLNIKAEIYCSTVLSEGVKFIPGFENVRNDVEILNKNYDTVVCVDSSDPNYAGVQEFIERVKNQTLIINIDHHQTNKFYGALNMVDANASSTTEIIYWFFKWNSIKIYPDTATSLLAGLITDTDNFTNSATTTTALMTASELVRAGANLNRINNNVVKNKTVDSLKLWGTALARLNKHPEVDIAHTYLTQKDFLDHGVDEEVSEGISNFLNNLSEAKIALVLKETKDGKIKGSLRTTHDNVDVSKIATSLGGGGHKKAAGFTVEGTIDEVLEKIAQIYKQTQNVV